MLPLLSRLSVSHVPGCRLRHRCSAGYQRISPLHPAFRIPLPCSSRTVSNALPGLSPGLSHPTHPAAYAPFTPSKSEQRSPPLYYRGCWHRVSRGFLLRYHQRTLGGPLPRQQADGLRAHPVAGGLAVPPFGQVRMPSPATFGFSTPFGALSPATGQIAHIVLALPPLSPMKSYCYSSIGSRSTCMPNPRCQRSF